MSAIDVFARLKLDDSQFRAGLQSAQGKLQGTAQTAKRTGRSLTMGFTLPVAAGAAAAAKEYADFEEAMIEVEKVTDAQTAAELGKELNDMATEIPVAQEELAGVAAVAGRLGIRGVDNIKQFSRVAAEMGIATEIGSEEAATNLAKLSNALDTPIDQARNMGSTINELSNNVAADSAEITESMFKASAGAGTLGVSFQDLAAMQATLVASGAKVARSGTRMNRMFTVLASNTGSVAEAMGMPVEEFRRIVEENPTRALRMYLDHLSGIESKTARVSEATRIFGEGAAKPVLRLANNVGDLEKNLGLSNEAFAEGTSLGEEFAAASDTAKADMQRLMNQLRSIAIAIGGPIISLLQEFKDAFSAAFGGDQTQAVDDLKQIIKDFTPAVRTIGRVVGTLFRWFADLPRPVKQVITTVVALLAVLGPVIWAGGALIGVIGSIAGAISTAIPIIMTVVGILGGPLTIAIIAIVGALLLLKLAWDNNWGDIQGKTRAAVAFLTGLWDDLTAGIDSLVKTFEGFARGAEETWRDVEGAVRGFVQWFLGIPRRVQRIASRVADAILGPLPSYDDMVQVGKDIVQGIHDGIDAVKDAAGDAASGMAGQIRDRLPFSPAKTGPLAEPPGWETYLTHGIDGAGLEATRRVEQSLAASTRRPEPGRAARSDTGRVEALLRRLIRAVEDGGGSVVLDGRELGRVLEDIKQRDQYRWEVTF